MRLLIVCLLVMTTVGCSSIRTKMWTRDEEEFLHPDSCEHLKGIPVMLKVPSHIEVSVVETLYASHNQQAGQLEVVKLTRPDLSAKATLKYTEKMFLVDPVHVVAGTGAYGFQFAKEGTPRIPNSNDQALAGHGYLHSLNYKADDTTIKTAASLLANILTPAAKKSSLSSEVGLVEIERVVAFHRFDLGSPTIDEEVCAFLDMHLNACHMCQGDGAREFAQGNAHLDSLPSPASAR